MRTPALVAFEQFQLPRKRETRPKVNYRDLAESCRARARARLIHRAEINSDRFIPCRWNFNRNSPSQSASSGCDSTRTYQKFRRPADAVAVTEIIEPSAARAAPRALPVIPKLQAPAATSL